MKLYQIQYDSESFWVEALSFADAIELWKRHVAVLWENQCDGTEEPESCTLVHDEAVIREQLNTFQSVTITIPKSTPPLCETCGTPKEIRHYSRGPSSPPGNGYVCPKCFPLKVDATGCEKFYIKKPIPVRASQWFKNGDHPHDACAMVHPSEGDSFLSEGKVVRYFRRPDVAGDSICKHCGSTMHVHGWIDTLEGGHIVCPGDWIITGVKGERYPIKHAIFLESYDEVPPSHTESAGQELCTVCDEPMNNCACLKMMRGEGPPIPGKHFIADSTKKICRHCHGLSSQGLGDCPRCGNTGREPQEAIQG